MKSMFILWPVLILPDREYILTMRKFPMRAACYTRVYQLNIGFYAITQA